MSVLKTSIAVPTAWNSSTTRISRTVSSRVASMSTWSPTATSVRASLRASGASSGYHTRVARMAASSSAPNRHAHACLSVNTTSSTSHARGPAVGRRARRRCAQASMRCSTDVSPRSTAERACDSGQARASSTGPAQHSGGRRWPRFVWRFWVGHAQVWDGVRHPPERVRCDARTTRTRCCSCAARWAGTAKRRSAGSSPPTSAVR